MPRILSDALIGVREGQPTLPDVALLKRRDDETRSRAIGFAVLFALVGAVIGVGTMRLSTEPEAEQDESAVAPSDGPPLRAGFLSAGRPRKRR